MRETAKPLPAFDNMQDRKLKARQRDEYSITCPVHSKQGAFLWVLLSEPEKHGRTTCSCWSMAADLGAPKVERPVTALERDHQVRWGLGHCDIGRDFKDPSKNLAMLGRVWGSLIPPPKVTTGPNPLGYELLRSCSGTFGRRSSAANAVLVKWIDGFGPVAAAKSARNWTKRLIFAPTSFGCEQALLRTTSGNAC